MYKTLFPHTTINELNKSINKFVLHGHMHGHNKNSGIGVPGSGAVLLGMLECEWHQLLCMNCQTVKDQHK